MPVERTLANEVAVHWLESTRTMPTRALQLSFEKAKEQFEDVTDLSIVLAILKNHPCVVPPSAVDQLGRLSEAARLTKGRGKSGRIQYAETIASLRHQLPKYLHEKRQGLHPYSNAHDCSLDLIADWIDERKQRSSSQPSAEDIVALGHSDYLRLTARVIESIPGNTWHRLTRFRHSSLLTSLRTESFDQKSATKFFKKLSQRSHLRDAQVPEHQDVVMMLSGDRIHVRPASFIEEAKWQVSHGGMGAFGSVHNLLDRESPIHQGLDALLAFEDLLNTRSASEPEFQAFFERHPRFLLGTDYSKLVAQPVLVREDEDNLIPDFILVPHSFARPTILDLKLPKPSIARHKQNRQGFLQAVMEARDQLLEYRTYFSSRETATRARQEFGCDLYLPRIAVVIGRSSSFMDDFERRKIESRVPDIEVITYDDIYRRAQQCRALGLL